MSSLSLPWKRVDTATLAEPTKGGNHYDSSSSLPRRANELLEAQPGEAVAMFVGLEVISGDSYTIHSKTGKLQAVDTKDSGAKGAVKEKESSSRNNKKKRKAGDETSNADDDVDEQQQESTEQDTAEKETKSKKKKRKKRKKKKKLLSEEGSQAETKVAAAASNDDTSATTNDNDIERLQMSWLMAMGGVQLHPQLCASLLSQGFWTPTPIQAGTLPAAILGRCNIVGAAPTGSGKTYAYLLPILQSLLTRQSLQQSNHLQALIMTPTRELALQVYKECNVLSLNNNKVCGTIVGGLAVAKQARVLQKQKPPILVATPGRLWELMSSGDYEHLQDLSRLQFLVIDEADRMIAQSSFPQLVHIFDAIHAANPMNDEDDDEEEESDDEDAEDRMLGLPGVPGEARVEMLGDVLERMRQQQGGEEVPEPMKLNDEEYEQLQQQQQHDPNEQDDNVVLSAAPPIHRQTFVYSATLTLPPSADYVAKTIKSNRKRKNKSKKAVTVEGAIAEILEKARATGQTKIVDLTSSDKRTASVVVAPSSQRQENDAQPTNATSTISSRLPPGLSLHKIECTQRHKDSHLYAYLVTTAQGASGPCLVFCNSIAAVRRVGATLQALRLPVRMLHANMAQKARLKAVESLKEPRSIVVATDVAARGLDIPSVSTVVHYDVARQVDTFIHRAGRTARGMGKGAVGSSLSLIAPGEDKAHAKVCEALHSKHLFEEVNMDGRLLAAAQERANLAAKIVECDEVETKAQKSNQWFQEAAEEAGLDLDEDMLDEGLAGGDRRDQHKLREAKAARARLRLLLAQPMQTQRFGKFLSSNSAAAEPEVAAHVVPLTKDRKKKKRRGRKGT